MAKRIEPPGMTSAPGSAGAAGCMRWEKAKRAGIDASAYYLVQTSDADWRDFDIAIARGAMIVRYLKLGYVRRRPVWICKIVRP